MSRVSIDLAESQKPETMSKAVERAYRKVSVCTWSDAKVRNLSPLAPSGQALFLMLLVGPQTTNIPGVQPVGRMAFAEMLGWDMEAFDMAFAEALNEGLVEADWKARLIFVPNAIKHNLPQSPNVVKNWAFTWSRVPECPLKARAWKVIHDALCAFGDSFAEAFKSACPLSSKPIAEPSVGPTPNPLPKPSAKPSAKPTGKATDKPSPKATDNQEQLQEQLQEQCPSSAKAELVGDVVAASPSPGRVPIPDCPHQALIALYAKRLPELPQPVAWEGSRAQNLRTRWRWVLTAKRPSGEPFATTTDEALGFFDRFFAYVATSDFLSGRNGKWTACDLGWLVKADNFAKVMQGNYDNKEAA